ncbi:MAG: YbhB/YbcL family Raf kinase inhibitor-like protein [Polyangia bacterium]|jgi:Raf kinase inhibitor-like YbhB/YbcL family protein
MGGPGSSGLREPREPRDMGEPSKMRWTRWTWPVFGLALAVAGTIPVKEARAMQLSSSAFSAGGEIPARHTCQGPNLSPPLEISEVPPAAKSLALIVDDPDAPDPANPQTTWVHWVLYDLAPHTKSLPAGVATPAGAKDGVNDWLVTGYRGPCPPIGRHRYYFKLYALDVLLPDLRHPTKAVLEKAMHGHVLAEATLLGLYQKR